MDDGIDDGINDGVDDGGANDVMNGDGFGGRLMIVTVVVMVG